MDDDNQHRCIAMNKTNNYMRCKKPKTVNNNILCALHNKTKPTLVALDKQDNTTDLWNSIIFTNEKEYLETYQKFITDKEQKKV